MVQSQLEQDMGYAFDNKLLLTQALTHRSYINEHRDWSCGHNERLEFLGDAVLELVVSEFLFASFPDLNEGELTKLRTRLVNTHTLALLAKQQKLLEYVHMGDGQRKDNRRSLDYVIACALEAIMGALYLDGGYVVASEFIHKILLFRAEEFCTQEIDPKSALQEQVMKTLKITPTYKVLSKSGPDHDSHFVMGVYFAEELIAKGHGPSKKQAEKKAAEAALILKGWSSLSIS